MGIAWKIKALVLSAALLCTNYTSYSQVVVEKSKDRVIISGVAYYIHTVRKGETSYSISRAYGISVEELTKENPPALYGLKEGQALRIPAKQPAETTVSSQPVSRVKDETKFIYHRLNPGETVYSLSKSYGVSENEIIQSNPGIEINKLPVGSEIAVPRRVFMTDRQKFDDQEKQYIFHKVLKGESLASIADKYGLTLRVLRRENRDLRFPQVGDFVKVPGRFVAEDEEVANIVSDSVPEIITEPEVIIAKRTGYTPVKNLQGSMDVAVLLPFYIKENSRRREIDSSKIVKGKRITKVIDKPDDWIYDGSFDFLEMYEGILLAADTLRSLGLNINLHPYDIRRDTVEITRLINSGALDEMDLIIGPVYSYNLTAVAVYAGRLGIPVVSPVPLFNNIVLSGNSTLFMANSSLEVAQRKLSQKVAEYHDHNIVFIHADSVGSDPDVTRFKNMIFSDLSTVLPYDEIRFKEFRFYSRSMFGNDSINRLGHALSDKQKNVVIIASEDPPIISELVQEIQGLSRRFDVKVLGYPAMIDIENLEPKYLFDLGINTYYPTWIDYSLPDIKAFNADFRKIFLTEPPEKSYAWQGYDITYYFLSGLAIFGKDFISHPEMHYPDLLQSEYDFVRKTETDGFENQKLFNIEYTRDFKVKLLKDNALQEFR